MTSASIRFGPLLLAPGVSRGNLLTYLYAAFAGVSLTSFVSVIMPYILNVNIGLPSEVQGRVAGDLIFFGELVLIGFSGVIGAWSDKLGRRTVLIAGLVITGLGYAAIGYATSVSELIGIRIFITFGIAGVAVMISTIQVDYPAEESRGKIAAVVGMVIGLGAIMIGVVFAGLPDTYVEAGYSSLEASRMTMFTMTAICIVTALIVRVGLLGGPPPHVSPKRPMRELLVEGMRVGKDNPRLLLAYLCGFVGRADLVVVGTFYSLWLTQAGIAEGMSPDEAAGFAGQNFALVMTAALLWAPVLGWLNDRLDRTLVMAISLALGLLGYVGMALFGDPAGDWLLPASIVLGIGQISVTQAAGTLLGQESPPELRGAVVGAYSVFGAGGILFVTSIGGRIYDAIAASAPFMMVGILNGLLALFGFWLWQRAGSEQRV
jgi:MFS family permease